MWRSITTEADVTSEWFFSNWFIHSDSTLPSEPDWLSNEDESASRAEDERSERERRQRPRRSRSIPRT